MHMACANNVRDRLDRSCLKCSILSSKPTRMTGSCIVVRNGPPNCHWKCTCWTRVPDATITCHGRPSRMVPSSGRILQALNLSIHISTRLLDTYPMANSTTTHSISPSCPTPREVCRILSHRQDWCSSGSSAVPMLSFVASTITRSICEHCESSNAKRRATPRRSAS